MKSTYLIWRNPPRNGESPDWQEITGKQFYNLVSSSAGKDRFFVKLASTDQDGGDGTIVMEATQADYAEWMREKNHADYLMRFSKGITVLSYHGMKSDDGEYYGEELLPNPGSDIEGRHIGAIAIEAALAELTDEEYRLIEFLYLSDKPGTLRDYERESGIPKSTVSRKQKLAFKKLKKFFEN